MTIQQPAVFAFLSTLLTIWLGLPAGAQVGWIIKPLTIERLNSFAKQVPFERSEWLRANWSVRVSMVNDLLQRKQLLDQNKTDLDKEFPRGKTEEDTCTIYDIFPGSRCGNSPRLMLEVQFEKGTVLRYRASYMEDGGTPRKEVMSWVEKLSPVTNATTGK